jgi:hypothetical protein
MRYLRTVHEKLEKWARLGSRTLKNGTRLIGHVPHVAPEAWLHQVFPPIKEEDLKRLERELPVPLPTDLRDFLLVNNGLNIFSTTLSIDGARPRVNIRKGDAAWQPFNILTPNTFERPQDAEPSFLFVGGYRWDGSKVYIDVTNNKVFRCSVDSARPLNKWGTFPEMLVAECDRIASLFDETGRKKDPDKPTTP